MYLLMQTFHSILTLLQAAIAAASARDRSMPMFFIELWNRVGRMGRRLEKLIAQWRAGTLPKARVLESQAGERRERAPRTHLRFPKAHGWLLPRAPEVAKYVALLETLLSQEEIVRFLDEVPAARRIVGVLQRMLIVPPGKAAPKMRREEVWPPLRWQETVRQAGMHVGSRGRLEWN